MEHCANKQLSFIDGCDGGGHELVAIVTILQSHHRLLRENVSDPQDLPGTLFKKKTKISAFYIDRYIDKCNILLRNNKNRRQPQSQVDFQDPALLLVSHHLDDNPATDHPSSGPPRCCHRVIRHVQTG